MRSSLVRSLSRTAQTLDRSVQKSTQTVYLTHVKWVSGKQQLHQYFSRYGKVNNVSLFFDPVTGLHRGFASVTFAKPEGATAAIQSRPHVIDGDIVDVEAYMPLKQPKSHKIM